EMSPLLDEALARLGIKDRDAVILRFFKENSVRDVAATMQMNEPAAQRRILRALEKLRKFFTRRGVVSTAAIIAGAISANSIQAAPASLAQSVSAVAVAKGAAASASTLTLIKGALKLMAWTKAKTAVVAGVIVLLAAGTTTVTVKEIQKHEAEVWRKKFDPAVMAKLSPRVEILPALPLRPGDSTSDNHYGRMGLGASMMEMLESAHEYKYSLARIIATTPLPAGNYDFIANLPNGSAQALQQQINSQFGLVERYETTETNVYLLTLQNPNAPQLKRSRPYERNLVNCSPSDGSFQCVNQPISALTRFLEDALGTPVIDQTGLTSRYNIKFEGGPELEKLKQTVRNEVGLELVPGQAPVEMLIVDKAQ
ncbi:MAG TPA: TIGR03435 family protein, partial [Candidatus Acidoferrum sp.]|nr:TIGR03435 family protein [Candidatus Acidoferrum sp.]